MSYYPSKERENYFLLIPLDNSEHEDCWTINGFKSLQELNDYLILNHLRAYDFIAVKKLKGKSIILYEDQESSLPL